MGLILVGAGIALYGARVLWSCTRTDVPVDLPISMAIGHVHTSEFKVNRNAPYDIELEVQKKIPFDLLNCLLGTSMAATSTDLQECPDRPSVVRMSWVLKSNGHVVARGSTDDHRVGAWAGDTISRDLGYFQTQSGRPYVLDVDVLKDGSALGPGNPRLKVKVSAAIYEDEVLGTAIVGVLAVGLALVGVILLLVPFTRIERLGA